MSFRCRKDSIYVIGQKVLYICAFDLFGFKKFYDTILSE